MYKLEIFFSHIQIKLLTPNEFFSILELIFD